MTTPFLLDKQKLYEIAEWIIAGMVLVFGFQYLKQIVAFVLTELYKILIQRGYLPI